MQRGSYTLYAFFLLVLCCFGVTSAMAGTLLVTESGTFTSTTPASSISSPGGTFSLSFNVDSHPTVLNSYADQFDVAYTNFVFTLNGAASAPAVGSITFFDDTDGGLFSVCFTTACPQDSISADSLSFSGPQAYSGFSTDPTILPGSYANNGFEALEIGSNLYDFATVTNTNITPVETPEPSSLYLLGTGVLGAVGILRRRFAV